MGPRAVEYLLFFQMSSSCKKFCSNCESSPPCSLPSTSQCLHCGLKFCLTHDIEHQVKIKFEQKQIQDQLYAKQLKIQQMELVDDQYSTELYTKLNEWKQNMINSIQHTYEKILNSINEFYYESLKDFERVKTHALQQQSGIDLQVLDRTVDELESIKRLSLLKLEFISFQEDENNESTTVPSFDKYIRLVKKTNFDQQDIHCALKQQQCVEQLTLENVSTYYDVSLDSILIRSHCGTKLKLFDKYLKHQQDIKWNQDKYGILQGISWSNYLSSFLLSSTKMLYRLNLMTIKFQPIKIDQGNYSLMTNFNQDLCVINRRTTTIIVTNNYRQKRREEEQENTMSDACLEHWLMSPDTKNSKWRLYRRYFMIYLYDSEEDDDIEIFNIQLNNDFIGVHSHTKIDIFNLKYNMKRIHRIQLNHSCLSLTSLFNNYHCWFLVINEEDETKIYFLDEKNNYDLVKIHVNNKNIDPYAIQLFGHRHILILTQDQQFKLFKI
ncbi:unnamed protein product [Didymodactylos carnosus]|uniref:Uncharacterized protein n=1 Tax=Didymodactylos carnosus TaxID=1234261 RepID=A0A813ZVP7_9BILA|nr:unnamed protein product [Didymodactylos carnosus]CAF0903260.1 unnamed protein product [Didymodactylos carnosus]CAF3638542.1 unnamed protein product [Didymodactylos carnosus]CAF3685444.1 unnamed protein product [Didymodactylos carnosus]